MPIKNIVRKPTWWFYGIGLVLLLAAAVLWCNKVNTDPERVFWGMLRQSLSTSAVTVESTGLIVSLVLAGVLELHAASRPTVAKSNTFFIIVDIFW